MKKILLNIWVVVVMFTVTYTAHAQKVLSGTVADTGGSLLPYASVFFKGTKIGVNTNENGVFNLSHELSGMQTLVVSYTGFKTFTKAIDVNTTTNLAIVLEEETTLDEVVVSGNLRAVSRLKSPVPVAVYTQAFLKKNPTPNIFEALQSVNGVRPQLNCNICNTGDIHINGLEGPYTMVLIDGMPIVSGLSTVYGLSGIPNSLIERIEVVKGPASSLYGSEAVGGLINIITKKAFNAPKLSVDAYTTSWLENNLDIGYKVPIGKRAALLSGVNYYYYDNPIDNNHDNFTDVTLQHRISVFNKLSVERPENRVFSIAGRYFYEDRWGGEMQWAPKYRGGDEVYGESIYTNRVELLTRYQLPVKERMFLNASYTFHDQNSVYGDTFFDAQQEIAFAQWTWFKDFRKDELLVGAAVKYNYYEDNTPATVVPDEVTIPGVFVQNEHKFNENHSLLLGARWDYDKRHGHIFTPRLAYKATTGEDAVLRLNMGTGFRAVSIFTEEHAALTGAREVVLKEDLKPERSMNVNLNYLKRLYMKGSIITTLEASAWYTYFSNQILPDYDTNPDQIIFSNLEGHAVTKGLSADVEMSFPNQLTVSVGATFMDVTKTEEGATSRQPLTERFSGTWAVSYTTPEQNWTFDYTGNIYGPMLLPLAGEFDPRDPYSPTWSLQNIQATYKKIKNLEIYGGVKNLLNWTPDKSVPFLIARANDPFDENVQYDANGSVQQTTDNPYALTFDPSYVYAPNQGIRGFIGLRYTVL
ncbi:TonB-dependent receptor [Neptunitalea chrysea]|uniref:TonB-dependent receptor n=1 Tax=Neptunitalea chrysea TaxID=1647581 RepID=A0A9W6B6P0_9FLAO|nr:TonB-dependent receptor [Neptunitalea chrysea]GLB52575.1 TonB-dependent receptor [Neptunitalea chrysea]